jgi:predicted RNA-binding protein Jag
MEQSFRLYLNDTVKDLLKRMGFEAEVKTGEEMSANDMVQYRCEIILQEGQNLLIGQHGANVAALLHLVKLLVREELPKNGLLSIDVNGYFAEKRGFLEREALAAVKEVEESGLPVMLRPMLSFERKMIHHLLANHGSVMTESVGTGGDRKILIRLKPEPIAEEQIL